MPKDIRKVLARVRWQAAHRERLEALFAPAQVVFVDRDDDAAVSAALKDCDVAIVDGVLDDRYLAAPNLVWAHCDQSGVDGFAPRQLADSPLIVTSSKGRSGPVLAEHAIFFMLSLCYGARRLARAQALRSWGVRGQETLRGLNGRRICIVGLGATGTHLARQCAAFGMDIVAYRRSDAPSDVAGVKVYSRTRGDSLEAAIAGAEIVALCASLNDESRGMVGAAQIAAMKPGGFLINMARARLVDEAALLAALRNGQLGGAGVDVADPDEPLAPWSPLWSAPNLLLTPHVTPQMPDRTARTLDLLAANLDRLKAGEPLFHRFEPADVFTPPAAAGVQGALSADPPMEPPRAADDLDASHALGMRMRPAWKRAMVSHSAEVSHTVARQPMTFCSVAKGKAWRRWSRRKSYWRWNSGTRSHLR